MAQASSDITTLDRPPAGWFALDVARKKSRAWDWVALMIDVDPDELKHCACGFPALFYVHPDEYRPAEGRTASQCWVVVPGKHRNADAAWDAIHDAISANLN
jgi:hypothetical protein